MTRLTPDELAALDEAGGYLSRCRPYLNRTWLAAISLLCLWASEAMADRSAVLILLQDGEATTVQGRFEGATLGEPIRVMVDTSQVFGSGFE